MIWLDVSPKKFVLTKCSGSDPDVIIYAVLSLWRWGWRWGDAKKKLWTNFHGDGYLPFAYRMPRWTFPLCKAWPWVGSVPSLFSFDALNYNFIYPQVGCLPSEKAARSCNKPTMSWDWFDYARFTIGLKLGMLMVIPAYINLPSVPSIRAV